MALHLDPLWLTAVFLVAVRIAPMFVMAPVLGTTDIPVRVRVFLSLAFAASLVAVTGSSASPPLSSIGPFLAAAMSELVIGVAMVFGVFAAFGALLFGGRLLDIQIGFGIANVFDPVTRSQGPLVGTALNLLAIVVFFAVDGHHMLIRGMAWSLERFPPGRSLAELNPGAVVEQFGVVFAYGLMIVAPAVIVLLLLDVGLSIAARTMPQMNIFFVAMPLKVVVGLLTPLGVVDALPRACAAADLPVHRPLLAATAELAWRTRNKTAAKVRRPSSCRRRKSAARYRKAWSSIRFSLLPGKPAAGDVRLGTWRCCRSTCVSTPWCSHRRT